VQRCGRWREVQFRTGVGTGLRAQPAALAADRLRAASATPPAALSGQPIKAPSFAGGYLPIANDIILLGPVVQQRSMFDATVGMLCANGGQSVGRAYSHCRFVSSRDCEHTRAPTAVPWRRLAKIGPRVGARPSKHPAGPGLDGLCKRDPLTHWREALINL